MNEWSTWRFIKAGFWLGIGFIVPSLAVYAIGTVAVVALTPTVMEMATEDMVDSYEEDFSSVRDKYDQTEHVDIVRYATAEQDGRLLINGVVRNNGTAKVSSIQLEAELFNRDGEFVYECSEYISKALGSNESENFQIKCGCKGDTTPEYEKLTVRVISANAY